MSNDLDEPSDDAKPALGTDRSVSQTLSRGLRIIEVMADAGEPMTAQELASALGVSRSVVYRLLRTLANHKILSPDMADGKFSLGLGLLSLSRSVHKNLREAAHPILKDLAQRTGGTAFLGVLEGDEVVCVASAEAENTLFAIRYREGIRRPITVGASGLAIRSTYPPTAEDTAELQAAREHGFGRSEQTLEPNSSAVSAPLRFHPGKSNSCVTIIFPSPVLTKPDENGRLVIQAAERIAAAATL